MDPGTGHLIDRSKVDDYELRRRGLDPAAYRPIPETHAAAALRKLQGEAEAHVSLTSGGKLSRLAGDMRQQRLAEKSRAKLARKARREARAARRQNRRPR